MPPGDAPVEGTAVLTVSEVAVQFGGVSALTSVSLSVPPGMVTGLIGPNGAGKTTLFNVISGLQAPDRGTVHLFDTDVTRMKPHRRARLGLARTFQRLELFGTLTAGENVQVGLESTAKWWDRDRLGRMASRRRGPRNAEPATDLDGIAAGIAADPAACERLLSGVGLLGLADRQSSSMPTGLARMVELARALAIGPKLLLLDEPGSGLDESESTALGDLLSKLAAEGMAVLLVEHDMELVMRVCDRIHVLDFGDIIASGPPDEIRDNPMVQAAYLGEVTTPSGAGPATEASPGGGAVTELAPAAAVGPVDGTGQPALGITVSGVRAAYGRIEVLHGVDLTVRPGERLRPPRPQRRRKVDAAPGHRRPHPPDRRRGAYRRPPGGPHIPRKAGPAGFVRHPRGPRDLPQPHRARELADLDLQRRRQCRRGGGAHLHHLPPPQGSPAPDGRDTVRWRAADARHLPGPGHEAQGPSAGRAVHGPRPARRR